MSGLFDPFGDFKTAGYLRNTLQLKDPEVIKELEHQNFKANLPTALSFLEQRRTIDYAAFLKVHKILFEDFYPWAGQDRLTCHSQSKTINKDDIVFCAPQMIRAAVEEGLRIGKKAASMKSKPGSVMGMFAYGHPFLDGNGRTMLLVHMELCFRAKCAIDWAQTNKNEYLAALSAELKNPNDNSLNDYLRPLIVAQEPRTQWGASLLELKGLDGVDDDLQTLDLNDAQQNKRYEEFENKRQYKL